ncbi:MAG: hypothetical protein ACE5GA_00110 [Candidatus Zixiibacteriota bacterium]
MTPAKLERCVNKVRKKGHSKSSAFAICNASLNKKKRKKKKSGK